MALYTITPPLWLKWLYGRGFLWDIKTTTNEVYITFDDGPVPGVTEWVLDLLKEHNIKATFFCIGSNVVKHPSLYQRVIAEGHTVGNHTFNHVNGLKKSVAEYRRNIEECAKVVDSKLFRPPYGKLRLFQLLNIRKKYTPVMWSVLSADFDPTVTPEQCLANVINHTTRGSIILFHDSIKAENNLRYALPRYLEWLKENGFTTNIL